MNHLQEFEKYLCRADICSLILTLPTPDILFIFSLFLLSLATIAPYLEVVTGCSKQDGTFIRQRITESQELLRSLEDAIVQITEIYCKQSKGRNVFELQWKC